MTGAIIGSAVIGAGASLYSGYQASKSQDKATEAQSNASNEQINFQKQQYADWQDVYGDTQDNLASYYNNLTPDSIEALGISKIQQAHTNSVNQLDQQLAQRGLGNSGSEALGLTMLDQNKASNIASVRANAPQQVADKQMQFLGLGLGNQSALQQGIAGAYGNQANIAGQQATAYGNQAGDAYNAAGQSIGGGINNYMTYQSLQNQQKYLNSLSAINNQSTQASTPIQTSSALPIP